LYYDLLKNERANLESFAKANKMGDEKTRELLSGVDNRHSKQRDFTQRMMRARSDLYRALDQVVTILSEQHGKFTVSSGDQVQFQNSAVASRYNAAAKQVEATGTRVMALEKEGTNLIKTYDERREKLLSGQK
jgi:hypothetical protein